MKPKPDYIVPIDQYDVRCPTCEMLVGSYVRVDNQVWLQAGALQAQSLHGRCCGCHTEFHYCASDKILEHLINRCLDFGKGR